MRKLLPRGKIFELCFTQYFISPLILGTLYLSQSRGKANLRNLSSSEILLSWLYSFVLGQLKQFRLLFQPFYLLLAFDMFIFLLYPVS